MSGKSDKKSIGFEAFVDRLKVSRLVDTNVLDSTRNRVDQFANQSEDEKIKCLLKQLSETQRLTKWQIDRLKQKSVGLFFLGKFRLLDRLGTGGMSAVYLAEHELTKQKRAIKVLPPSLRNKKSYLERFYQEGRAVAALNHPNIVRIYDLAEEKKLPYMVMEFVAGTNLHELVFDQGPMEATLVKNCIVETALGLQFAHDQNLVHRDIKPANILLTKNNHIKILDLGLAKIIDKPQQFGISAAHNETMMGTADYLAPEQANNSQLVDHRADIYSLGCSLFYLLTGTPPFPTGTLAQRISAHQNSMPPSIEKIRPDVDSRIIHACERMLCKRAEDRFQSCNEIIEFFKSDRAVHIRTESQQPIVVQKKTKKQKLMMTSGRRKRTFSKFAIAFLSALILLVAILTYFVIKHQT